MQTCIYVETYLCVNLENERTGISECGCDGASDGGNVITSYLPNCTLSSPRVQMLALSVLDSIVAEDQHQQWLSYLVTKGYLKHLVDSLPADNSGLHAALAPVPSQLRPLYIFQTKMVSLGPFPNKTYVATVDVKQHERSELWPIPSKPYVAFIRPYVASVDIKQHERSELGSFP